MPLPASSGEEMFSVHCRCYKLTPEREYVFAPPRKFRFDFAWPDMRLAVEIEGGTLFGKSRHSRGAGFVRDCEKYNLATLAGWSVLRFTTEMVQSGNAIDTVMEAIQWKKKSSVQ